jgi:hypothetical protein
MNIFVLDSDPDRAAQYHCNKHVVKMILEAGTMLSTAHWVAQLSSRNRSLGQFRRVRDVQEWLSYNLTPEQVPPWKISHVNHPCSVWTRESLDNYRWHSELGLALCAEYTRRYGKRHKSQSVHEWLARNLPPVFPNKGLTPWAQCVPDDCKGPDTVQAYRDYYSRHKSRFAVWEPRAMTPSWYRGQ